MRKITRRYLAGLLDGEGYFGILPRTGEYRFHHNHKMRQYFPCIKMSLTTPEILKEIVMLLGGHIHIRPFNNFATSNCKNAYCWESRTFVQVEKVLNYVHKYLIIKKIHADILAEFLKTKSKPNGKSGKELDIKAVKKRENLYYLMRKLNHKGRLPAETERESSPQGDEATVRTA